MSVQERGVDKEAIRLLSAGGRQTSYDGEPNQSTLAEGSSPPAMSQGSTHKQYSRLIDGDKSDVSMATLRLAVVLLFVVNLVMLVLLVVVLLYTSDVITPSPAQEPPFKLSTVSDFEDYARSHLDGNAWRYYSCGATEEITLRDNTKAYKRWRILPKRQVDVSKAASSLTVTTFGGTAIPIGFSPTAHHIWATPEGERATVRAALKTNAVMIISMDSSVNIREIARVAPSAIKWQQMYILQHPNETLFMVRLAEETNCKALVVTIDKPSKEIRYNDLRGLIKYPPDSAWGVNYPPLGPSKGYYKERHWNEIYWLTQQTTLPIIVKGVLTAHEADMALQNGASAILVSNHGGRALDGVPATVDQLQEVVAAVAGRVPVYIDGGIRSGLDAFKALALGADMVFVGRPVLWGLAHSGQSGAERVVKILLNELINTMELAGAVNKTSLNSSFVYRPDFCSYTGL